MSIVRQSITALYQEAERNAADGSPMLAVIHGKPSQAGDMPAGQAGKSQASNGQPGKNPATSISALATAPSVKEPAAIVARFDELKQLAEEEALQTSPYTAPAEASEDELIASLQTADIDGSSDLTLTEAAPENLESDSSMDMADAGAADLSLPDLSTALPAFGDVAPVSHSPSSDDSQADIAAADTQIGSGVADAMAAPALPAEPPAPEAGNADDLDIADIHSLVQQAWEDESAIAGASAATSAGASSQDQTDAAPDLAGVSSARTIATAMDEIAAAVEQSNDAAAPELSEEVKAQLAATIRSELQAELQADLAASLRAEIRSDIQADIQANIKEGLKQEVETNLKAFLITDLPAMVKAAVAEAVAETIPAASADESAPAAKTAPKTAAKKRTTTKKSAAARAAKKKTPPDLG